jgi:hypothetical protein
VTSLEAWSAQRVGAFAGVDPTATRSGGAAGDVALVLGEAAALTAVFAPLTVRLHRPG